MKILIASESEGFYGSVKEHIAELLPEAKSTQMYLIDAGSWFMANEPEITIIDAGRHKEDAKDLLRLTKETNAGQGKKVFFFNDDDELKAQCEKDGIIADWWMNYPPTKEKLQLMFELKAKKKPKDKKN